MWLQPLCPTGTAITSMSRRTGLEGNYKSQKKSNLTFRPDDGAVIHAITTFGEVATNYLKLIWSFGVFVPIFDKWYLSKVNIWQMLFPRWTATLQTQTRLPALSAILFGPFAGAFFNNIIQMSLCNITLHPPNFQQFTSPSREYKINQEDNEAGIPGILIGDVCSTHSAQNIAYNVQCKIHGAQYIA